MATFAYARNKYTEICHSCCEPNKGKKLIEPVIQSYFCLGEKQSFEKDIGSLNKCHSAWMTQLYSQLNGRGNKVFFTRPVLMQLKHYIYKTLLLLMSNLIFKDDLLFEIYMFLQLTPLPTSQIECLMLDVILY